MGRNALKIPAAVRLLITAFLMTGYLHAIETSEKLFECTKIFEARKAELLVELERIDEQKQALEALKTATDELLSKKEAALNERESEIAAKQQEVEAKESEVASMLEENRKILDEIKAVKTDKVTQTYAKMKAGAAAAILEGMDNEDAAKILMTLKPATTGKILAKMDTGKASAITLLLTKQPE